MKRKVDLSGPKKHETKFFKCPACRGLAVEVRSKTTRMAIVNDEPQRVTDKKWTHRGVVCLKSCGVFPATLEDEHGQRLLF